MRSIVTAALAATVVLTAATAAPAFQTELAAYDAATAHICDQGVTPEVQAAYQALVAAVDEAKYGYGRSSSPNNFWGPTDPQMLLQRCRQGSGGDSGGGGGGTD